jgi:ornithine cyclodeaminase
MSGPVALSAEDLEKLLAFPALVEALREGFRRGIIVPVRHHHTIQVPGEKEATLLLMPAWDMAGGGEARDGEHIGVKIVTVHPGNAARGLPSVQATYLLLDGRTGELMATLDGTMLTLRRTAAASALAASYLAREDSSRLLMVGAGALAPHLIEAHASQRPIERVEIWNHRPERAEALAATLRRAGARYEIVAVGDLEAAAREADIISCATLSAEPLIRGAWLKAGAHLDLVGAFTPGMRESDDAAVTRAAIFVDTRAGALKEAGDIVQPVQAGLIGEAAIRADLFDLCRGLHPGRTDAEEVTLFKSVGTALEDLVAAAFAMKGAAVGSRQSEKRQ